MTFDAFYTDERNSAPSRASHPVQSFWNLHTEVGTRGYADAKARTLRRRLPNPLSDPALASILPQLFAGISPTTPRTQAIFDAPVTYWLYVSPKLVEWYRTATDKRTVTARVSVFFGVGPEPNLFGLRSFFDDSMTPVLVGVSGFESGWKDVPKAWGVGISATVIRKLLDDAGLAELPFQVEVMAGYSTGYRGLNLTAINKLLDLTHLTRFIYLDAFYWHDDHPMPPPSHQFYKKLTVWAADTVLHASSVAEIVIVGYTHPGATPRDDHNEPKGPLKELTALRPGSTRFLDLEFARTGVDPIADDLEKVCLARLLQAGIDDYYPRSALSIRLSTLISLLPPRGNLGVAQIPGYTYFRTWRLEPAVKRALAAFAVDAAIALVVRHQLLAGWSTDARIELRHRDFVQEIGKELLLP